MADKLLGYLIVFLVIGIPALIYNNYRKKKLIGEGRIIDREHSFWNFSEHFTVTGVEYDKVLSEINSTDFSQLRVQIYPNYGGNAKILFKSNLLWNAELLLEGQEGDTYKYRFAFTHWETRNGTPRFSEEMNIMETTIEKIFLRLDPNTVVRSREQKTVTGSY